MIWLSSKAYKTVGDSLPQVLKFVLKHTGLKAGLAERFRAVMTILRDGPHIAQELIATRCQRGADIARLLRFPETVAAGIYSLDEHYNGQGKPDKLAGAGDSPVFAHCADGAGDRRVSYGRWRAGGAAEVRQRAGSWFDPQLVQAFERVAQSGAFWSMLRSQDLTARPWRRWSRPNRIVPVDEDYLDDIAAAFGQVVDSKSPYTSGHSERVALYTDMIAEAMGVTPERRRWLKRGALLHDVGKLGVSNSVLDKAGKLDADEWLAVQQHARLYGNDPVAHRCVCRTGYRGSRAP